MDKQAIFSTHRHQRRGLTRSVLWAISCPVARRTKELGPGIGKRLKRAQRDAGLTVRELAERANTTPTTIMTIRGGEGGNCGVGLLYDVAKALGVSPAWLAYGE